MNSKDIKKLLLLVRSGKVKIFRILAHHSDGTTRLNGLSYWCFKSLNIKTGANAYNTIYNKDVAASLLLSLDKNDPHYLLFDHSKKGESKLLGAINEKELYFLIDDSANQYIQF